MPTGKRLLSQVASHVVEVEHLAGLQTLRCGRKVTGYKHVGDTGALGLRLQRLTTVHRRAVAWCYLHAIRGHNSIVTSSTDTESTEVAF